VIPGDREHSSRHGQTPRRPPNTAQRPDVETWLVEISDRDSTHPYRHTYRLSAAEPELYDTILYACGEDYREHQVSMILCDASVWVAIIPVPGDAVDACTVDACAACSDSDWADLPPAYVLRHLDQQTHTHLPAGRDAAGRQPLNLTVSARRLPPPVHGAG